MKLHYYKLKIIKLEDRYLVALQESLLFGLFNFYYSLSSGFERHSMFDINPDDNYDRAFDSRQTAEVYRDSYADYLRVMNKTVIIVKD